MWINAIVFEGPIAAIEGLVRAAMCLLVALLLILISILCQNFEMIYLAGSFFIEVILCLAVILTCLVPGAAACMVYRKYDPFDEWKLQPLITVLGHVDSRRFLAFSFGGGWSAANVIAKKKRSQDSLGHKNILFFPRNFMAELHAMQFSSYYSKPSTPGHGL